MSTKNRFQRGKVSLERALSKLGLASRTQARELIDEGKVKVHGKVETNPLALVVPETLKIEIAGQSVVKERWRTLLFHKPRSVVTTRVDEKGRRTVFSTIGAAAEKLHAVGRLDFATTGLLILTNDTILSSYLTDPANKIPRTYVVAVRGELTPAMVARAEAGVLDDREELRAERVVITKASGRESQALVTLTEGKNREIRRLFLAFGHEVTALKRIAFGGLQLGELEAGASRDVSQDEVKRAFPDAPFRAAGLGQR